MGGALQRARGLMIGLFALGWTACGPSETRRNGATERDADTADSATEVAFPDAGDLLDGSEDSATDVGEEGHDAAQDAGTHDAAAGEVDAGLPDDAATFDGATLDCLAGDGATPFDTDGDHLADTCDDDDDGDGFRDADDPAPLDASIPGDFSTVESLLSSPLVKAALDALDLTSFGLRRDLDTMPPDITGYYASPQGGSTEQSSNRSDLGRARARRETRYDLEPDTLVIDSADVYAPSGSPSSYGIGIGNLFRGVGARFTIYARELFVCTAGGANFTGARISITSGEVGSDGSLVDLRNLLVTVHTEGALNNACRNLQAGDLESSGGWVANRLPDALRVAPTALELMCIDQDAGYVPTESWTRTGGAHCNCRESYQVTCT